MFVRTFTALALILMTLGAASAARADDLPETPLWPDKVPDQQAMPGPETETLSTKLIAGRPYKAIANIAKPTLTVYAPKGKNTGAAVVVIPGGGFEILAIDLEGTEICDWLTSTGVTCVLLKYRVPSLTYDWHCNCRPDNLAIPKQGLEDTQRTIRWIRHHASDYGIDPKKIGVLGFSAGGYLVASISTNYDRKMYAPVDEADKESARPDFAVALYPGHLVTKKGRLNPNVPVTSKTPPTFLLQAVNDPVDDVADSLLYFAALKKNAVSVEMHLYAEGGHAFGLRPTPMPISEWPRLVDAWMRSIGMTAD